MAKFLCLVIYLNNYEQPFTYQQGNRVKPTEVFSDLPPNLTYLDISVSLLIVAFILPKLNRVQATLLSGELMKLAAVIETNCTLKILNLRVFFLSVVQLKHFTDAAQPSLLMRRSYSDEIVYRIVEAIARNDSLIEVHMAARGNDSSKTELPSKTWTTERAKQVLDLLDENCTIQQLEISV